MSTHYNNINSLCKVISETFDLAVFFINPEGNVIFEHLNNQVQNPLYQNEAKGLFNAINFDSKKEFSFPLIRKTDFFEKFLTASISTNNVFEGTILIGPFVSYSLSEERINALINETRAFSFREKIFNYYHSIPNIENEKIINISVIVFKLFNNILLTPKTITDKNLNLVNSQEKDKEINMLISNRLQTNPIQHDRLFEKQILDIVQNGRVDELDNFQMIKEEEDASVLSKSSHMRSVKNHLITLITLASIAAIDGGLDHEIAIFLRDEFILQLEDLNRIDETRELGKKVLYTFTEKVQQVKNEQFSKTIATCRNYINKNVYEDISHRDIAEMIGLSPKYLSVLFKKEVNMTIGEYIQQTKIEEAKKLLAYSSNSILDISALLNFSDQSYFTKVFKNIVGITPKIYRERHHLQNDE